MSAPLRVVFDTNVFVSALLFAESMPGRAVRLALRQCIVLSSTASQDELRTVLSRKKFTRTIPAPLRTSFLNQLALASVAVAVTEKVRVCRDPRDDKFLEVAVNGRAHCIVTGDGDLLALDPFRDARILSPRDFLVQNSA